MALARVDRGKQCCASSFVFITAPNVEALEKRLRGRGTETEEKIQVFLEATLTRSARAANDQQRSSAAQWGRLKSAILQVRLKNALAEIEYGQAPGNFEHVIVNDDLEVAFTQLCTAIGLVPPPLVVAGPSGVGKGTLIKKLQVHRPSWLASRLAGMR
jgi:guanylate kinase